MTGNAAEDAATDKARLQFAESMQREWGCPAAGHSQQDALPRHLAAIDVATARVTGSEPCGTCPFAELERAPEWVIEITTAAMAMGESLEPLTFRTVTGRSPTFADVTAWLAWKRAGSAAWRSDQKAAEERRKKPT